MEWRIYGMEKVDFAKDVLSFNRSVKVRYPS